MLTKRYTGGELTLYDSTRVMPMTRYHAMNKFAIQESGIGSTIQDVMKHFSKLSEHLRHNDVPNAAVELENLHYNFFLGLNKIDIKGRTFLCFVHSINGRPVNDVEDDTEAEAALLKIEGLGLTTGEVGDLLDDIKKKLISN